ncbi:6351_t:CDS:1, partial [Gigaspora margarita]
TTSASECKKLLLPIYTLPNITSLQSQHEAITKATLHHIYTCQIDNKHLYNILSTTLVDPENSNSYNQHTYTNIYQYIYKESLKSYSTPFPSSNFLLSQLSKI